MSAAKSRLSVLHRGLKEERDYWTGKLSGLDGAAGLRPDFPRTGARAATTETLVVNFDDSVAEKLDKLTGGSPFLAYAALLSALKVCLHKHTGARTVVVGSPARAKDNEPVPAPNALAIVSELHGRLTFRELLMAVRENLIEAYARQSYPFERLARDLRLDADAALFDVSLALRGLHGELPGAAAHGLRVVFEKTAGGFNGSFSYDASLFRRETVERFAAHLSNALDAATDNVNAPLVNLDIVSAEERESLLVARGRNVAARPDAATIHEMFEAQAARTPERVAVVHEGVELTYAALDARAEQIARRLRARGVGPEALVAVCAERSAATVAAMLGVLKAGGAYLPLDPAYPAERLAYMLADSGAKLLLTPARLQNLFAENAAGVTTILVDDEADDEADAPLAPETSARAGASNTAYVIYTSGSTGRPKGVAVQHAGLCNMVQAQTRAFGVTAESRVLQFASFCFDASVSEVFMALTTGAALHLASKETLSDTAALAGLLAGQQITTVTLPPAVLALMSEGNLPALRTLIAAGEACPAETAARWSRGRRFFNAYGPTEATVCATLKECGEGRADAPPIGGPISNVNVYVLDADLRLAPDGAEGELYVGGAGVARGYLNRPALTAEKFVPNPFSSEPGARLYRTGDRVRWNAEGALEFVGRVDNQVKLRGFRIEPGEIESALAADPSVRDASVVVREDEPGDRKLVAYVVAEPGARPDAAELRERLRGRLPEYMIPSAFVTLDSLPLTPNGKVDKKALPAPSRERAQGGGAFVAPRTPTEEAVAAIWSQVLGVERVGATDSFFDLGGHSLLATQIMTRVRESLRVEVKLDKFFAAPTVAGLAEHIESARAEAAGPQVPPIVPVPRDGEMPLSFAQQRLWFVDQLEPGSPFYNIPSAIRLRGRLDRAALEQSLNEIVRRHETLRASFPTVEGQPRQVIAPALNLKLEVTNLGHLTPDAREAEAQRLAVEEAMKPFDLGAGPLVRATLLRLSDEEHVALLTMHHIVSDGWSMGVLIGEVAACYEAFSTNKPALLAPLPVQYADFAAWQRELLAGPGLEPLRAYWLKQLANLPTLTLPTDFPRPAVRSLRGAYQVVELPADLSASVREFSRQAGATPFMTLLAAFNALLHRYTGQTDIVVGTDVANRNRAETEGLIGFFINHVVLRTDLSGDPSFSELVERARRVSLEGFAHEDMPFDLLVKELNIKRDLGYTPLFQVLFVVQNAPSPALELPGLTLSMIEADNGTTKFDLALFVTEAGETLRLAWKYNPDLFEPATISRMAKNFETLLAAALSQPGDALHTFVEHINETERQQAMNIQERHQNKLKKLGSIKRKAISVGATKLVETAPLDPANPLPLAVSPVTPDLDPYEWAAANRAFVREQLQRHGGVLFRGFALKSPADFERFAAALCPELFGEYGDLPREAATKKIYGATPYPADQPILYHNESSHLDRWPMKIFFFCVQPPETGGETPIVDCRRVLEVIDPELRRRLTEKGLVYVRNFAPGLDVSWENFFRTSDRAEVERKCLEAGTEFEWVGEEGLRTRQRRAAVSRHPLTGEEVFFNQVQLHHNSSLAREVRQSLLEVFGEEGLPRNVVYGDGTVISDEEMAEVDRAYEEAAVLFPWQRGDMLMLDNMMVAHGRKAYTGERKIVVTMGEIVREAEVAARAAEKLAAQSPAVEEEALAAGVGVG